LRGAAAFQVQSQPFQRLPISDLGHPAPKFENEVQMIEIERLRPVFSVHSSTALRRWPVFDLGVRPEAIGAPAI
jgi:hypothetical protein